MNETGAPEPTHAPTPSAHELPRLVWDLTRLATSRAAVVCASEQAVSSRIVSLLVPAGYEPVLEVPRAIDAIEQAANSQPRVAVIDLASTGQLGLRTITAINGVAPSTAVILISPFATIAESALAAGAAVVLADDDLRHLPTVLRDLIREA